MVVVDKAKSHIGKEVEVEFERLNQTAAGTMMFAKLTPNAKPSKTPRQTKTKTRKTSQK